MTIIPENIVTLAVVNKNITPLDTFFILNKINFKKNIAYIVKFNEGYEYIRIYKGTSLQQEVVNILNPPNPDVWIIYGKILISRYAYDKCLKNSKKQTKRWKNIS